VEAVVPSDELGVNGVKILVAGASFGQPAPALASRLHLTVVRPQGYQDGCVPTVKLPSAVAASGWALLTERSPNCTFGARAEAAEALGAAALLVVNTVEGIYRNRSHGDDQDDYDCGNGKGFVSSSTADGGKLAGFPLSSCARSCGSGRCLLTGDTSSSALQVCCAWDSYIGMTVSYDGEQTPVQLPAVFLRMVDGDALKIAAPQLFLDTTSRVVMSSGAAGSASVDLYARWRPWANMSSVLMWGLGCCTAFWASWASCDDVRRKRRQQDIARRGSLDTDKDQWRKAVDIGETQGYSEDGGFGGGENGSGGTVALELTFQHALGFIVVASLVLVVLFYVNLYLAVTVAFCGSAASSTATVLWHAPVARLLGPIRSRRVLFDSGDYLLGPVTTLDATSHALGATLALVWFCTKAWWYYAFVLQDLFGCCLCVLFLSVIRLPSLSVAAGLLAMAFCYDIFFVFLSPLIFHESVMVKVATGTEPTEDASFCEKYPSDSGCETTELPMLLLLPRLDDFEGGYTMLGLGDIVLPGLLLSFACRYDYTCALGKSNVGPSSRQRWPVHWLLVCCGYALGLALANAAVYLMDMGQPALLYLVPCTLGPLSLKAQRDGTLRELWHGPREMAEDFDPSSAAASGSGASGGGGRAGGRISPMYGTSREDDSAPMVTSSGSGKPKGEGEPLLFADI
jgi:signal peptide peptidase-like protein 2B